MSLETRSNSALFKRAEQLKRWEESDTNREPTSPKQKSRKVKFSAGCVFLAACAAGDKEEVLKLLEKGADINTANVDGLTALHQACIDDNLDMVEFLVEQGADVNRGDNEGWTPLHATAGCGLKYIAEFLIEKGANVAAVNNDGELPIDIAQYQEMEDLLKGEINKRGINCDAARSDEEKAMLKDAKEWLATKSSSVNEAHPKTGATALHVAAAKGYIDVMKILLQCGADIDAQDVDGWTPLHAAAYWGQKEACHLLVESLADLDSKNYVGQTAFDLAGSSMLSLLDDLKQKQNKEEVNKRKAKKRAETQDRTIEADTQNQVKKVKVEITGVPEENNTNKNNNIEMEVSSESESESSEESTESESEKTDSEEDDKKNKVNSQQHTQINEKVTIKEPEITKPPLPPKTIENSEDKMPWRQQIQKPKSELSSPEKSSVGFKDFKNSDLNSENEVTLRRARSFQNDESFFTKYKALHARIQAYNNDSSAIIPPYTNHALTTPRPKSDIILTNSAQYRNNKDDKSNEVSTSSANTNVISSPTKTTSPATSPQPQNNQSAYRRSFVPPVRDEESETQRKAHAKRVRETRRSTQGVTLEEIKSAEQLVKLQNQPNNNNNNETSGGGGDSATNSAISVSVTIATGTPTVITRTETTPTGSVSNESPTSNNGSADANNLPASTEIHERRPSWRLKVDGGSKFKLEDATKPETPSTPSYVRRLNQTTNTTRPSSAPIETAETTVTIPFRRPKSFEEKDQDKENDVRNAQATLATQAAIQRRRRPKRRSTGVVSFENVEDMDQEKDPAGGGDSVENTKLGQESGSERSSRTRISSTADIRNENGEIDYKKLYEEQLAENDRLKDKLRKTDEELKDTKQTLEKINLVTSKNSLSELEKRERRAMERKLSEMEEELKQLQKLKAENEKLKAENRSLTRVINKLTNSAKK
ncbi:protein phosphatase 1 regulatory subunit 12C isoform X7 [Anthonomus grandis grandis]|uniref:protein phosphatase 1 regulatory subunit 12C isoform X7 n=1 Tax=Anthonomus grandis grandis TaxID=2921223 RepID=UPI00216510C9|nr:protein phosphatase 1 regulatory subunit 12C isoform X7 [Anthonomus grandis grandis]